MLDGIPTFYRRDISLPFSHLNQKQRKYPRLEYGFIGLLAKKSLPYRNIIASDIDDLRTADIPVVFKGSDYITLKLVSTDAAQIREQMKHRPNNGLIDYELQQKMNEKNLQREPLVNEVVIDVAGKTIEEVLNEAIEIIDTKESLLDYEYVKPPKELFYSWVFANGLR